MPSVPLWLLMVVALLSGTAIGAQAADDASAPWGRAQPAELHYAPQKVVYDVTAHTPEELSNVLDRASYLSNLYGADPFDASIVLVLHGDEIAFFAVRNYPKYQALMRRAQSLTVGGVIEIRMCRVAAHRRGFEPSDIHGFVEVVPMADAEIVRLQREEGYAYMR